MGALQSDQLGLDGIKPVWFGKSGKHSRGVQALRNRKFDRSTVYVLLKVMAKKVMASLNMNFWTKVQHEIEHFLSVSAFSWSAYPVIRS
jgi:hypothetical protein